MKTMNREKPDKLAESIEATRQFAERYRADPEVRSRVARGDVSDLGLELPAGVEVKVVEQSADTYYFTLPPPSLAVLSGEMLEVVSGGTGYAPDMSHLGTVDAAAVALWNLHFWGVRT